MVKLNLVYEHPGELIGFTDLDNIGNGLQKLEAVFNREKWTNTSYWSWFVASLVTLPIPLLHLALQESRQTFRTWLPG